MRIIRIIAGVMVFIAVVFSFLSVFTLFNRLYIYFNRDRYRVESFEVAEAVNPSHRKGFSSCWLSGTVAGHTERLRPELPPTLKPECPEDLLTLFPRGSTISVLYNPSAPEMLIQGETLRVFHFTQNFWHKENRLLIKFLCFVLLPVPFTFALYRYLSRRSYLFPKIRRPN